MTQNERAAFITKFFNENCLPLTETKGKEYSRHENDVNSNFKRLSEETAIPSKTVLYIYLKKHLDAISSYIKTGQVLSEPIESRIADAINYLFILASLIEEEKDIEMKKNIKTSKSDEIRKI